MWGRFFFLLCKQSSVSVLKLCDIIWYYFAVENIKWYCFSDSEWTLGSKQNCGYLKCTLMNTINNQLFTISLPGMQVQNVKSGGGRVLQCAHSRWRWRGYWAPTEVRGDSFIILIRKQISLVFFCCCCCSLGKLFWTQMKI